MWIFRRFYQRSVVKNAGNYFVIVMPNTLHYLIPCLSLLTEKVPVYLILNGAKKWEIDKLASLFPNRPRFKLTTLPYSSVNHGPVINMLLKTNQYDFGIIDHDLYIFDHEILASTDFSANQSMKALFKGVNPNTSMQYPHTFFLYFNVDVISQIMHRFQVDARIYYSVSEQVNNALQKVGLTQGTYIKEYMNYFDTLHVILGLSFAQDLEVDYMDSNEVFHIGGTSMGSQYSKDLLHMYMSMRFLELLKDDQLDKRYRKYLKPFSHSEQIWQRLEKNYETQHMRTTLENLMSRLEQRLS